MIAILLACTVKTILSKKKKGIAAVDQTKPQRPK